MHRRHPFHAASHVGVAFLRATAAQAAILLGLMLHAPLGAEKFYSDDPLIQEPRPMHVDDGRYRKLSDYYDFVRNLFLDAGERQYEVGRPIPAQAVNTLGEPMEGSWWTARHYYQPMSTEELKAGVSNTRPPAPGKWTLIAAKSEGVTPGFTIKDSNGEVFFLKFDPLRFPEIAISADIITSRLFHAVGYHVPEYYIVRFDPADVELGDDVELRDTLGEKRKMERRDVIGLLLDAPRDSDGRWRAVASRLLPGKPLGPFRFDGTRSDDPNDIVLHEHRRDIRGYRVFCAWVNHDDSRAINTADFLQEGPGGLKYVKHYLIDFGSTLGSATDKPNSPRNGEEYLWNSSVAAKQFFSVGLWLPEWAKKKYPGIRSVGRFESDVFDPEEWVPEYPNPAFINALPDDLFWGAKQVMAFTDEEIRSIVEVAEYSDPRATDYVTKILTERRDKIGRAFFAKVLPIDKFVIRDGTLTFEDLEVKHGIVASRTHSIQWYRFNNQTEEKTAISGAASFEVPAIPAGEYAAAVITAADRDKPLTVYLRNESGGARVVGIERTW